jgi:hypothetical protein
MRIQVHTQAVSGVLDSFEELDKIRVCHEHRCPTCGLSWGHSNRNCASSREFWLVCPICERSVGCGMAPLPELALDSEFSDYR